MMFRPDRRRRGHDPMLGHKMLFFVLGGVLGIAGIALDRDWMVYVAMAFLLIGLVLRVTGRRDEEPPES